MNYMELPRFDCACTGGTYGPLHRGHMSVFDKALRFSDFLVIRVTTDTYLDEIARMYGEKKNCEKISPFRERKKDIQLHLDLNPLYTGRFDILPLDEIEENCINCIYGERTKAIFVGSDSVGKAIKLIERRRKSGLSEVILVSVPVERAYNKERISSTGIREGIMDTEGNPT